MRASSLGASSCSAETARQELRLPEEQLEAVKQAAKARGIPYTSLVRQFIEEGVGAWAFGCVKNRSKLLVVLTRGSDH